MVRPSAVAGTWYPGQAGALAEDVDAYLADAGDAIAGDVAAIIAPHAGLMFSGPVAAHAYKTAAASGPYDVVVLVGPSHFVAFDGVAVWPDGAFATPLGDAAIDEDGVAALGAFPIVHVLRSAHRREHSLEMQLPFVRRLFPDLPILPLLMGAQRRDTIEALAAALGSAFEGRRPLLVASTDLSHYFPADAAAALDGGFMAAVGAFDADALLRRFESHPEHDRGRFVACGGGPAIAVMLAARELGARDARVLKYGHSGEISGDYSGVVGYLAAAFGRFADAD